MKKNLLRQDKKGVSIMIAYVILVIISLALAVGVYAFLQGVIWKPTPECDQNLNIRIVSAECFNNGVRLTLENNGLFNIDRAQIRIGDPNRIAKTILNGPPGMGNGDYFAFVDEFGIIYTNLSANPPNDVIMTRSYFYDGYTPGDEREIDVTPAEFIELDNGEFEFTFCNEDRQEIIITCN